MRDLGGMQSYITVHSTIIFIIKWAFNFALDDKDVFPPALHQKVSRFSLFIGMSQQSLPIMERDSGRTD